LGGHGGTLGSVGICSFLGAAAPFGVFSRRATQAASIAWRPCRAVPCRAVPCRRAVPVRALRCLRRRRAPRCRGCLAVPRHGGARHGTFTLGIRNRKEATIMAAPISFARAACCGALFLT